MERKTEGQDTDGEDAYGTDTETKSEDELERTITEEDREAATEMAPRKEEKRQRGRPVGSKNKPKTATEETTRMEDYVGAFGRGARVMRSPIAGKEASIESITTAVTGQRAVEGKDWQERAREETGKENGPGASEVGRREEREIEGITRRMEEEEERTGKKVEEISREVEEMFNNLQSKMVQSFEEVRRETQRIIERERNKTIRMLREEMEELRSELTQKEQHCTRERNLMRERMGEMERKGNEYRMEVGNINTGEGGSRENGVEGEGKRGRRKQTMQIEVSKRIVDLEWKQEKTERDRRKNNIVIRGVNMEAERVEGKVEEYLRGKLDIEVRVKKAQRLYTREAKVLIIAELENWN